MKRNEQIFLLSDTADSPLHCLKSSLGFLPLTFLISRSEAKALQKPVQLFAFFPEGLMFLFPFSLPLLYSSIFNILFHSLSSALKMGKEEK